MGKCTAKIRLHVLPIQIQTLSVFGKYFWRLLDLAFILVEDQEKEIFIPGFLQHLGWCWTSWDEGDCLKSFSNLEMGFLFQCWDGFPLPMLGRILWTFADSRISSQWRQEFMDTTVSRVKDIWAQQDLRCTCGHERVPPQMRDAGDLRWWVLARHWSGGGVQVGGLLLFSIDVPLMQKCHQWAPLPCGQTLVHCIFKFKTQGRVSLKLDGWTQSSIISQAISSVRGAVTSVRGGFFHRHSWGEDLIPIG